MKEGLPGSSFIRGRCRGVAAAKLAQSIVTGQGKIERSPNL